MKIVVVEAEKNLNVSVTEDTQFVLMRANKDPDSDKESVVQFDFSREGVSAEIIFLDKFLSNDFTLTTIANHLVPHTSCVTFVKAVLDDSARFNYTGKILINKNASQTSSYLNDNVLVIGEGTKHHSEPILQIENNDVQASHGSTTGTINLTQLFYLNSRGLSEKEAKNLIVEGFLSELISRIEDQSVREKLLDKVKS